jgi:hypothetical protein
VKAIPGNERRAKGWPMARTDLLRSLAFDAPPLPVITHGTINCVCYVATATSSASLPATSAIGFSAVLRPEREPSKGLTSRRASYVVP